MSRLLRLSTPLLAALFLAASVADMMLAPATAQQPPNTGLGSAALLGVAGPVDQQQGTSGQFALTPLAYAGAFALEPLTFASPIVWNMQQTWNATVTVTANFTIATPTNPVQGQTYHLYITQGGSGSYTPTWPSSSIFDWGAAGAPTLSTAVGKVDDIVLICVNAATPKFYASAKLGF